MNQVTKKRKKKKSAIRVRILVIDEMLCTDDDDVGRIWVELKEKMNDG